MAKDNEARRRKEANYERASNLVQQKQYDQAIAIFSNLGSFKDSRKRVSGLRENDKRYKAAKAKFDQGKYAEAEREFGWLGSYRDARKMSKEAKRIRTQGKRRKRAAEINEQLTKLRAEERTLSERVASIDEARRIVSLPEPDESGCLLNFTLTMTLAWVLHAAFLLVSLSNNTRLSPDHIPLFAIATLFGPVLSVTLLAKVIKQSRERKEAERLLKTVAKDDNTQMKLDVVRQKVERCEKELRSLGGDISYS